MVFLDDGLVLANNNRLYIYDSTAHQWTEVNLLQQIPQLRVLTGNIASDGQQLFLLAQVLDNTEQISQAIIKFNLSDYSSLVVEHLGDYNDITMGLDGHLYVLQDDTVHRVDQTQLSIQQSTVINEANYIAVDTNSDIYFDSQSHAVYYQQSTATINEYASIGLSDEFFDIDINENNRLLAHSNEQSFYAFFPVRDEDQDGLPYWWEFKYGLDDSSELDAQSDTDLDGLTALQEFEAATNPNLLDTDADGLSDSEELNEYLTRPLWPDSDGDGLWDGSEVKSHLTDPNEADSDGDGFSDASEIDHLTDPNDGLSKPQVLM